MEPSWRIVLEVAVGLIAVIAAVYGFTSFLDARIDKKINDEQIIRRIAAAVRPSVVFDDNSSILIDQGALTVIERITVEKEHGSTTPNKITVLPRKHLAHPPLITTLDAEAVQFTPARGVGLAWVFSVDYVMYHEEMEGKRRYRLEVI